MNDTITMKKIQKLLQEMDVQSKVLRNIVNTAKIGSSHQKEAEMILKEVVKEIKKALR